jgi:phosphatidylglycerophosphate synthase
MKPTPSYKERKSMLAELSSEYVFIVTPFVFLVAIKLYAYSWPEIVLAPDWSLVSCIIFGQISVRMSRSAIKYQHADSRQFGLYSAKRFFLVAVSLLFYFGMVAQPTLYLGWCQIGLFALASFFHFKDGLTARILEEKTNR